MRERAEGEGLSVKRMKFLKHSTADPLNASEQDRASPELKAEGLTLPLFNCENGLWRELHFEFGGFAYGRSETSPASENIERFEPKVHTRNYSSVEQIQDKPRRSRHKKSHCVWLFLWQETERGVVTLRDA